MQVEVDIYSGRPNPRWLLTPAQAAEFLQLMRALPAKDDGGARNQNLGYRGLIVTGAEVRPAGYDEIVIGDGVVETRRNTGVRQYTDQGRTLEYWLLQTGQDKLEADLYEYLAAEISRA